MRGVLGVLQGDAWTELVTAALLGTDRRPLENSAADPTSDAGAPGVRDNSVKVLLDLAAAHRQAGQAATPLLRAPAPETATGPRLPSAPARARVLFAELLARPEPPLVNAWLGACAAAGTGVPVEHWSRLAELAARSTAYDRSLVRRALGPRGLWFLSQNPRWARLATEPDASLAAASPSPDEARPVSDGEPSTPPTEHPAATVKQWEETLSLLVNGHIREQTQEVARSLAVGLPLVAGRQLLDRLELLDATPAQPGMTASSLASRRAAQWALGLIRRTIATRLEIAESFRDDPFRDDPFRDDPFRDDVVANSDPSAEAPP